MTTRGVRVASPFPSPVTEFEVDVTQFLPEYSQSSGADTWEVSALEHEHAFHLSHKKTMVPWLTLTLQSRATDDSRPPVFHQRDKISGSLELVLDKEEYIDNIVVAVSLLPLPAPGLYGTSLVADIMP